MQSMATSSSAHMLRPVCSSALCPYSHECGRTARTPLNALLDDVAPVDSSCVTNEPPVSTEGARLYWVTLWSPPFVKVASGTTACGSLLGLLGKTPLVLSFATLSPSSSRGSLLVLDDKAAPVAQERADVRNSLPAAFGSSSSRCRRSPSSKTFNKSEVNISGDGERPSCRPAMGAYSQETR